MVSLRHYLGRRQATKTAIQFKQVATTWLHDRPISSGALVAPGVSARGVSERSSHRLQTDGGGTASHHDATSQMKKPRRRGGSGLLRFLWGEQSDGREHRHQVFRLALEESRTTPES
jgi:hypothetical protein